MDERIVRSLRVVTDFPALAQLETNVRRQVPFDEDVATAFKARADAIARTMIAERTNLDLSNLTPAEDRIVAAASEYLAIKKREGHDAGYTIRQIRNRGMIEAAEVAVSKRKPTQGFKTLHDENLDDLSYEQIIVDHPEEFSARALWYARRTLGLPNETEKPPARPSIPAQIRTEELISWLRSRATTGNGHLGSFSNADAALAIGMDDMHRHGRVFGNIQSRLDFACYKLGLPPLGLAAEQPFDDAWRQEERSWAFPVEAMQRAAQAFRWQGHDFDRLISATGELPGQAYLVWQQELSTNEAGVRAWAEGLAHGPQETPAPASTELGSQRNPDWTREEHILALDLYMRLRGTAYGEDHPEVIRLSETLRVLARLRGMSGGPTFRNPNGVSMKMMNFRRLDPDYTVDGRVGLNRGSSQEEAVWRDFANDPPALKATVSDIMDEINAAVQGGADDGSAPELREDGEPDANEERYWVFVCNPAKWAIDRFLAGGITEDTWSVRPSDRDNFAPGQLAIVRVGVDRRSQADRDGHPPLEPGIYALCEVESEAFPASGADDSFWAEGEAREPGWPTVRIRYLRGYLQSPLTIERLRAQHPDLSHLLLDGFRAASFPISANDFRVVVRMLGEDLDDLPAPPPTPAATGDELATLEKKYLNASPEVKTRVGRHIERGPVGAAVKRATGFKCQLCEAMGRDPIGFLKPSGEPYVEAHHVMPVSTLQIGSLAASNIMTLCPNHHRQVHYGGVSVVIGDESFSVTIDGTTYTLPKTILSGAYHVETAE